MNDLETLLTDDDFATGFEQTIVDPGKYKVKTLDDKPRIRVAESGNRYLNIRLAATETASGERVNSKVIYHSVPFEGVNKKGEPNRRMFAGFFSALGLEKDAVKSVYANLMETAPVAAAIGDDTEVALAINGDPISLKGRVAMASIKKEEYAGKESNKISSVWAAAEATTE